MDNDTEVSTEFEDIFFQKFHRPSAKMLHYFPIYDAIFSRFRNREIKFLEIGVGSGGSLDMWKMYFGPQAHFIGVDINPFCARLADSQVDIVIGDQADPDFLLSLSNRFGPLDIILDDGGHKMHQQITAFENLYPALKEDGIYICEDIHTSYIAEYGGELLKDGTFIEHMKTKIDDLNGWHHGDPGSQSMARTTHSITFYESLVAVHKLAFRGPRLVEVGFEP